MTDKIVILSTCASAEEGEKLARLLVERKLAACVNVVGGVRSFYRWRGALDSAVEFLLIVKSSRGLFERVRAALEEAHSYEIPEIIAVPIVEGAPAYLSWIGASLEIE